MNEKSTYSVCMTRDWKTPSSEVRHGFKSRNSAIVYMLDELEKGGFRSFYQIHTKQEDGSEIVDYGSHTNFILIRKEI